MKTLLVLLAAVVLFTTAGCGQISHGDTYHVEIDPAFSPSEVEEILVGVDAWRATVPVHFTVSIGLDSGEEVDGVIRIYRATAFADPNELGDASAYVDGGDMGIPTKTVALFQTKYGWAHFLATVVEHELGHCMGLKHHDDAPAIMNSVANTGAHEIRCDDVMQWQSVRGRDTSCAR
jgi:hypothetical protein